MMKNFKLYLTTLLVVSVLISCKDDDDNSYTPPRPYDEQYATEITEIEEYLTTHYLVGEGINSVIDEIPEGGTQTPLSQHPNLAYKMVNMEDHEVEYKLYYIKFNEGINERPSHVDSIFVSYRGWLFDGTQFDTAPNPVWQPLDGVIEGWTQVFTEFKTGTYNSASDSFENSGSGIMFVPSGLAYYNATRADIPAYSPLVFSFNLNTLRYCDHDGDGIQSRFEVENLGDDPRKYDSDGDGKYNYLDIDDDNDGWLTRFEIKKSDGTLYPFDEIPACSGSSVKVHLDPNCIGPVLE